MEKRTPHCKLNAVKALIEAGKVRLTGTAQASAYAMGFDVTAMISVVMGLTSKDFHKAMTTYADHTIWQDVYRPSTEVGRVYLKLTVTDDVLIVSFKALEEEL